MTTLAQKPDVLPGSDTLAVARESLSGKRAALIGFDSTVAGDLSSIITEAQAFTRSFALDIKPSADILRPFELMLVNVEAAAGSPWLNMDEMLTAVDRSLAVGDPSALVTLLNRAPLPYREFSVWPASREELLFRCLIALRSASRSASRTVAANSTVVLADDDPSITMLVRLTLQRNGMTCETASNGGEALELVNKFKPCAAVLDLGMPNIDGFQVLSRIKNNPDVAQTKVILLTGSEQEMDVLRGFSLGADDYVTKPFNPMELLMRLKRVLGRI
jgi:CheY-like chemotaxis protein